MAIDPQLIEVIDTERRDSKTAPITPDNDDHKSSSAGLGVKLIDTELPTVHIVPLMSSGQSANNYGALSNDAERARSLIVSRRKNDEHCESLPGVRRHRFQSLPGDRSSNDDDESNLFHAGFPYAPFGTFHMVSDQERRRTISTVIRKSKTKDENPSASHTQSRSEQNGHIQQGPPEPVEMTMRLKFILVILAFSNLCSTTAFSCIAPFFPKEATNKNLSATQTGIIFGVFEFVMFVAAPVWGRLLPKIGSKRLFVSGIITTGTTSVMFGLLKWVPSGTPFFVVSLVVRVLESLGASAYMTASFAICAATYTGRVAQVIGVLETFNGLGFALGPPVGGFLYQIGGYFLPFVVLGAVLLTAAFTSMFLLPTFPAHLNEEHADKGMLRLVRTPSVLVMVLAIMTVAISLTFIDPTLAPHLESFHMSAVVVGLIFFLLSGTYAIAAPIWGMIADRKKKLMPKLMVCSCLTIAFALLLMGPSPIFGFGKELWIICTGLVVMGLAMGGLFIPTFEMTLNIARSLGYPDNFSTYGLVSGIFQSSFSFGGFFGPTVGSFLNQQIGFAWTATIVSGLFVIVACLLFLNLLNNWRIKNKLEKPVNDEESAILG